MTIFMTHGDSSTTVDDASRTKGVALPLRRSHLLNSSAQLETNFGVHSCHVGLDGGIYASWSLVLAFRDYSCVDSLIQSIEDRPFRRLVLRHVHGRPFSLCE
jgi:hypothetical protein